MSKIRLNQYNSLEEFCNEYEPGDWTTREINGELVIHWGGLDFRYNHKYYRLSRNPSMSKEFPILSDGRRAQFEVMLYHCETYGFPMADYYTWIGFYADLEDLLENCYIEGRKFKEVIMDDYTILEGQD